MFATATIGRGDVAFAEAVPRVEDVPSALEGSDRYIAWKRGTGDGREEILVLDDEARTSLAYFVNSAWARTSRSGGRGANALDPHGRGANVELHVEACARVGCAIARITFRATRAVAAGEELLWEYPVHKGAAAAAAPKRKRTEEYEASLAALLERDIETESTVRASARQPAPPAFMRWEAPQFVGEHFDEYFACYGGWFRGTVKSIGDGASRAHNGAYGKIVPKGKLLVRYSDGCEGVKTVAKLRELRDDPSPKRSRTADGGRVGRRQ